MEQIITDWGYFAVFLGSLIEGESVILTAGFLASQGYLSLYKIILISFIGTLIADQSIFFIGHFWGNKVLDHFPKLQEPASRAFALLHKYNTIYILTFRFIYGIRIISPVIIGAAGVSFRRFAILNLISAIIWSIVSCSVGYLFGGFLMNYLTPLQRFFVVGSLGFFFLGLIAWKAWQFFYSHEKPCEENL
ncbi:MAG: DedA family protein [Holosporales bacterium]